MHYTPPHCNTTTTPTTPTTHTTPTTPTPTTPTTPTSDALRNAGAGQLAVCIPKGINNFPENSEKMEGTIDIWWIVRILYYYP